MNSITLTSPKWRMKMNPKNLKRISSQILTAQIQIFIAEIQTSFLMLMIMKRMIHLWQKSTSVGPHYEGINIINHSNTISAATEKNLRSPRENVPSPKIKSYVRLVATPAVANHNILIIMRPSTAAMNIYVIFVAKGRYHIGWMAQCSTLMVS